jgi:transcriptional regulator with XRE-family HTH domain
MVRARALDPEASLAVCLGAVLRRLRTRRELTQGGLGRLAGYDGSYIGAVERAAVRPSRDLVERCDRELQAGGALVGLWVLSGQEWSERASPDPADAAPPGPAAWGDADPEGSGPGGLAPGWAVRPPDRAVVADDAAVEAMELARRAEASDVGAGTLDGIERAVRRLRRAASGTPPESLIPAVGAQRRYVGRLLEGRLTPRRRRRLLVAAGWLSVLLAQLHFDAGDREAAEANRDAALRLARQAEQAELAAWAVEALAWWALADGRHGDALQLARSGQDLAPPASAAALQLALDEAQALACLGDHLQAAGARRQAALTRAMLPGAGFSHPPAGAGAPAIARVD